MAYHIPGHTIGSMCCMFTKLKLCCSGFFTSIGNNDDTQDQDAGVRLDLKWCATTNKGGIKDKLIVLIK